MTCSPTCFELTSLLEMARPTRHVSDAGVPGITSFRRRGTKSLAEPFQIIGDRQARDKLHAFVAELSGNPHTKRATVPHRKLTTVHSVHQQSLRMQCIGHVDTFPPVALDRKVDHVTGLWESPCDVQDVV